MEFNLEPSSENFLPKFVDLLNKHKAELSPKQQKIADFILENPSYLNFATIQQVAMESGVNVATVVRFCQALGFSGFSHLRNAIRHYYIDRTASWESLEKEKEFPRNQEHIFRESLEKDLENLKFLLSTIDKQPFPDAIEKICRAQSILCIGSGENSGARVMASLLRYIGKDGDSEVRGGTYLGQKLKDITEDDLLVSFGYYRCDPIIIKTTEWATRHGIPTIVITDSIVSPLATASETVLLVSRDGVSFFQSSVTPLSLVNAIIAAVTDRNKEQAIDKLKTSREIYKEIGVHTHHQQQGIKGRD